MRTILAFFSRNRKITPFKELYLYAFFEMTDKSDKYNKLLRAMGLSERNPRFG